MKAVNAIVIHRHGTPAEVVQVEEQPLPELGSRDVLVKMRAAPINPVDLNVLEGKYPVLPELPAVPGVEGAGVIGAVGAEVRGLTVGTQVVLSHRAGSWREACVLNEDQVIAVPGTIPPEQAAMLKINPATAWRMLHDFVTLEPGAWVIQNAANSGVGRAVIQIAHSLRLRTVSLVRRAELVPELQAQGADAVLLDGSDDLRDQIKAATGNAKISLALNAVGGESALNLANAVAAGGTVVTYGAMGRQPLRIPNGLLIFKDQRWRGFWITKWYQEASQAMRDEMFEHLFQLATRGILHTPVEKEYLLSDGRAAIEHAGRPGRSGKILFRFE